MSTLWQDVFYGLRMLAKRPLFTVVAALSLALGIGLNTAIFTLINTILWGSLAFQEPDRLAVIWSVPPGHPDQLNGISVPDYLALKERSKSFEAIGVMDNDGRDFGAAENGAPAQLIFGEEFSSELIQALGAPPLMGRLFTAEEDQIDHPAPVIVLSHRLWQRRFNGDKNILNQSILVNGVKTQVIGVMQPDFRFSDDRAEFLAPLPLNRFQLRGSARYLLAAGRLRPGVSMKQAQQELTSIIAEFAKEHPADMDHGKPWTLQLQGIREGLFGFMSRPLLLLQGAVAFVLLIACANVAGLLLARASARHTEVAIRAALGAGRGRIFRQFLTESLMLSLVAGVFGVLLAWWGVRALVAMAPSFFPRLAEVSVDRNVLLFSLAVSLITGIVFGLVPAVQASKSTFVESLKDATRGGTSGGAKHRLRGALVTAQLALALVLLIGSGLLIRSFLKMQGADLGCDPSGLLTFTVRMNPQQFAKAVGPYKGVVLQEIQPAAAENFRQIFDRLQTVSGVQSVAATTYAPLTGIASINFSIEGRPTPDTDLPNANYFPVTPNFFQTMKTPLLKGRDFTMHDTAGGNWVAIINDTMARRFWPNEDPLGKRIRIDVAPEDPAREIIGVAHDIPTSPRQKRQEPAIFVPFFQASAHTTGPWTQQRLQLTFLLRTPGDPMKLLPAAQHAVAEINPNWPLANAAPEEKWVERQIQYPRYYSMLLGLFAFVATALAAVGIYGIMAYAVEQRTREIGIRMALGAAGWDVLMLIVRQVAWMVAGGLAIGIAGAMLLTRFISSELWEVQATDPATFAGVSVLLAAVAVLACLVPTRRAVRVDPTVALRYE
jgi:putative ABC transport system permease protein